MGNTLDIFKWIVNPVAAGSAKGVKKVGGSSAAQIVSPQTEIGVPAIGPTKFLSVKASNPSFGANTVDLILDTETVILTPIGTVASFMASVKLTGATFSITAPAGTAVQIALMA